MRKNPTQRLGSMSHTGTVRRAFLNKRAQSRLKPARVFGPYYKGVKNASVKNAGVVWLAFLPPTMLRLIVHERSKRGC